MALKSIERQFGLMMACVFLGVGFFGFFHLWSWLLVVACWGLGGAAGYFGFFVPERLAPLAKLWMKLSEILGKVVSPIVLGVIFFGLLTPIGFVGRLFGRDVLRMKKCAIASYWIPRSVPLDPASFKNQF